MAWLALDQGTSSTKAAVLDDDGAVVALAERSIEVATRHDGSVETDPEQLWTSVLDAGRAALAAAGNPKLAAVSLANQGESVLAWDSDTGQPRSPVIVWQDRRARGVCDRVAAANAELVALTGLALDPYFVAPKLRWLRDNVTTDGVIGTTDTWLLQRLCGALVTDVATASRSLLLDLDRASWSDRCVEIFGLGNEVLPTIVANDATVGATDVFGASTPVRGLCVDQQAALFAEDCHGLGDTKCTYGTGAFVLANTATQSVRSGAGLVSCVAWDTDATGLQWCLDGQVYTVGAAVQWLEHVGLIGGPGDLDRLSATASSDHGVVFVPGLAGLAAPFWAADARGAFMGLSLATSTADLVHSVLDGIAAQVAWLIRGIGEDLGAPVARLRVDGGVSQSVVLLQLQADLAQVPIDVYPSPHATALGVAQLGGAPRAAWSPTRSFVPTISRDEAESRLDAWHRAAEATIRR